MKKINWNKEKNIILKIERNISFEEVAYYIENDYVLDIMENENNPKYSKQKYFILNIKNYIYYVSFVETDDEIFLKTIIPSRKLTKKYLKGEKPWELN